MRKTILGVGWLALLLSLGIGSYLGLKHILFLSLPEGQRLAIVWQRDLKNLQNDGHLPKGWSQIGSVHYVAGTDKAKTWLEVFKPEIPISPAGDHSLEVLVISWEDEGDHGAIIQYDLANADGDLVWELGRTFVLDEAGGSDEP